MLNISLSDCIQFPVVANPQKPSRKGQRTTEIKDDKYTSQ